MKKKILGIILFLSMCLTIMAAPAGAATLIMKMSNSSILMDSKHFLPNYRAGVVLSNDVPDIDSELEREQVRAAYLMLMLGWRTRRSMFENHENLWKIPEPIQTGNGYVYAHYTLATGECGYGFDGKSSVQSTEGALAIYALLGEMCEDSVEYIREEQYEEYKNDSDDMGRMMYYHYPRIEFLRRIGVTEVKPDDLDYFHVGEAVQSLVTILGYKTEAEKNGGYPEGYLQVAEELGVIRNEGINVSTVEKSITPQTFSLLCARAMNVPLCLTQYELQEGIRDFSRFSEPSYEETEICNGKGRSGRYETLLTFQHNIFKVNGQLVDNGTRVAIQETDNCLGLNIKDDLIFINVNAGNIPSDLVEDMPSEIYLKTYDGVSADVMYLGSRDYRLSVSPNKGKANITKNADDETGDMFEFTAETPAYVNEISICGDVSYGDGWHEITYDYLGEHYYKDSFINERGNKTWIYKFRIYDAGDRTFMLRADGTDTDARAYATLYRQDEMVQKPEKESETTKPSTQQQGQSTTKPAREQTVKMYTPDGRRNEVKVSEVETWREKGWYSYPVTTVYAPDGRNVVVNQSDVQALQTVGWYSYPVVYMFAPGGREIVVNVNDIQTWEAVGWYTYRVAYMFAPDGREIVVNVNDIQTWEAVGWYTYRVTYMFAPDGRKIAVNVNDVQVWKNVGWFDYPVSA